MSDGWSYIGRETKAGRRNAVGTVVCVIVDKPEYQKDNAKLIAGWIRDGLTVERVPVEWVRKHLFSTEPYHGAAA